MIGPVYEIHVVGGLPTQSLFDCPVCGFAMLDMDIYALDDDGPYVIASHRFCDRCEDAEAMAADL